MRAKPKLEVVDIMPRAAPYRPRLFCEGVLTPYVTEVNMQRAERHKKDKWRQSRTEIRREQEGLPFHQCAANARYKINGKYYCRKHAALVALDLVAVKVET